jgi:hypothetical protein
MDLPDPFPKSQRVSVVARPRPLQLFPGVWLKAYPNNPLFANLIDPSHEVLWTIVMGGFHGRLADTL